MEQRPRRPVGCGGGGAAGGLAGKATEVAAQIRIRSTCRGATGVAYDRQHLIDLSELKGISRIGEPPLLKIAKSLESIQNDLHHVATGFSRPKIDVFAQEDRERERKELEERRTQSRQQHVSE